MSHGNGTKLRVGIEAKWFYEGPPGGQTYAHHFTNALISEFRSDGSLRVFLSKSSPSSFQRDFPDHVECQSLASGNSYAAIRWGLSLPSRHKSLDWIISHNFSPAYARARRAVIVHDLLFLSHPDQFTWKERLYFGRIRRSVRDASLILAVSEYTAQELRNRGFVREGQEIVVCPCAASDIYRPANEGEIVRIRGKYELGAKPYILYLGRLNIRKNLERLIRAFAAADLPRDVQLALAGKPDWKMFDVDALVRDLGVEGRVSRLGFVDLEDAPALYSGALFFAYVPLAEGFGIPPLEAMSCGTPVLVSNTTAMPEVAGRSGHLVDPLDVSSIRRGLEVLSLDSSRREELASRTLEEAKRFSWAMSARRCAERLRTVS